MRKRRHHRLATVVTCVLLAMAACASSEPYDAESVSLSYEDSPINELLGVDIAMRSGDLIELERAAERSVVECMLAAGFEYTPIDFAAQFGPEDGGADPDSREYAAANGYGISIRPAFDAIGPQDVVDPNDEIRATLSEAELEAYELALFGEAPVDGEPVDSSQQGGCVAQAYEEVFAAQAELGEVEQFFGRFGDELAELEQRFRSDPRFLELEDEWAECMNEKGFEVSAREDIFIELNRRMSEVAADLEPDQEPSAEIEARMDEVREWERSVAVAEWDCTQPVQDEMQALRYGYEALFLERNQDIIADR